ncbi:hypothetical protein EDF56_106350 [Novosphingobium sp. PhB165]|nr:hypothetical protein EDF56_106350 [Novosphingobium sp. PhB165]
MMAAQRRSAGSRRDTTDHAAYRLILEAASNRQPCPSNDALAAALGARGAASGAAALTRLERSGQISVERNGAIRIVTVTQFGLRAEGMDA